MIRLLLFYILFTIAINPIVFAQDTLAPILHYTMREGLSQMKTTSLVQDSLGYMWIGTRSGLNRFDGENIVSYTTKDGLPHDRIHDLVVDTNGHLVILTYKGLSIFDGADFHNYPHDFLSAEYHMYVDHQGEIWIVSHYETTYFHHDSLSVFKEPLVRAVVTDLVSSNTYFIGSDAVWTYENGKFIPQLKGTYGHYTTRIHSNDHHLFFEWNKETGKTDYCYFENGNKKCLKSREAYFSVNPEIAYYRLLPDGSFVARSRDREFKIKRSPIIRMVDAFKDDIGNFWLADENGFSIIQNEPFIHFPYRELPYVWTINQDRNNNYWAGSFGYGLLRSQAGEDFMQESAVRNTVPSPFYLAASVRDDSGNLYLGNTQGIVKWDGKQFDLLLKNEPVYALSYDSRNDRIIAGGIFGLRVIDPEGRLLSALNDSAGLHNNEYIQNLSIDDEGMIWAGSYTGLSTVNTDLEVIQNYENEKGNLPGSGAFCTFTDENGETWIGGDYGLMYYDRQKDSIYSIESSVLNSLVKSIIDVDRDHLLIGAKDGLYLFNSRKFVSTGQVEFHVFNMSNGYRGMEPGFTGFYKDHRDDIWICSASSVDVLKKGDYDKFKSSLTPKITMINGRRLPFYEDPSFIYLARGERNVNLNVDAIGLIRPQNVKFQFQIDDGKWSKWTGDKQIVLNELNHGQHRFRVRAGPTDLPVEQTEISEIEFGIDLPFYSRSQFPAIAIISVLVLLVLAFTLYYRQRLESKRYLRQLSASKFLRSQLLLSELNPHFIFNILSSIQHKVLMGDRDEAASYVVKLSKMIRNFLSASHQSHKSLENYRENDISLEKELELLRSYLEFEQMKSDGHFDFQIEVGESVEPAQTFVPPMLIQPFVENAIKHGILLSKKQGNVLVNIYYLDEELIIEIEDDGVGRDRAKEIKGSRSGHVSLGTVIIDQRIELLNELGYHVNVITEDVEPHGTKVTIRFKE